MAQRGDQRTKVLERGDIYFIFRPKVEEHSPKGVRDVERFYLVLKPEGKKRYRMIVIGQKTLPEIGHGERNWGFVETVVSDPRKMEEAFRELRYETKTRGERERPAARPAGEGVYAIVRHGGHTHLAYSLELPRDPDKVQRDLKIEEEGSYIITVKNPDAGAPPGVGLKGEQQADFPKKLKEVFRGRKFADCDPPDFLDYEGAELILIGASDDLRGELGIPLKPEKETPESADIFTDLKMKRADHPVGPLFKGKWE